MFSLSSAGVCPVDPSTKPSFPLILLPVLEVLWILSLAVKPSRYRRLAFFLPIATIVLWSLACTQLRIGRVGVEVGLASRLMIILLCSSVDILFAEPQRDVQKGVQDKKVDDAEAEKSLSILSSSKHANGQSNGLKNTINSSRHPSNIASAPFLARFKWAASFWFNPRGIGYPQEPSHILPPKPSPTTTRKTFLLHQLCTIAFFYVFVDVALVTAHLYDSRRRWALAHGGFGRFDPWRLVNMAYGLHIYAMLVMEHSCVAMAGVASGLSEPQSWPPLFHSPTEAYTLKRFWGKFWQQLYRRCFQVTSSVVAHNFLGLPRSKSKLILFTRISLAFFFSALLHFGPEYLTFQTTRYSGSLLFFGVQPVGLLIEDLVISLWCQLKGQSRVSTSTSTPVAFKLLGFLWVFLWLGYTFPPWTEPLSDGGYIEDVSNGFPSIIMGLWKGQWLWPENNGWVWKGT